MPDILLPLMGASGAVLAFFAAQYVASLLLPGERVDLPDDDGGTHVFKFNGLAALILTLVVVGVGQALGWFSLSALYHNFLELFVAANLITLLLAFWLYWRGKDAPGAPSGFMRGFFVGRALNPVWRGMDVKFFSYRPSLIGLALFNLSFAVVQYENHGEITLAMALYQAFTLVYVLNYFQFEQGMIYTWDIMSERFGLMLAWGNLVFVPFFYCIAGWWLVNAPYTLSPVAAVLIALLFAVGFWMFRGANQQKHRFRQDPNITIWGRPVETLDGRLLVSGFWGIGRHLNYTGEICVYTALLLTTGFVAWEPWLLLAWLVGLLAHRSHRDDLRCQAKYGELWDRYKQRARFSMVPYIY